MEQWSYTKGCGKVQVPLSLEDAEAWGWHKGVDYNYFTDEGKFKHSYNDVVPWCRENLDPYLLQTFGGSIWFYREADAMFCRLRFA